MLSHQTKREKNAGFTLVEIMVVILIFAMLLLMGNYGNITKRREKARIEELTVDLITLIDQQKVDTLLGKTESGAIVRKRKMVIDFNATSKTLTYNAYTDLAEDSENSYYSYSANTTATPLTVKSWAPLGLDVSLWNCDGAPAIVILPLTVELQSDTMSFKDTSTSVIKHIVIQLSRQGSYREIHIDRRTGMTFEREGSSAVTCN
jgi:prepilin-type N-terminal cleavage/methylation domain-containing protein